MRRREQCGKPAKEKRGAARWHGIAASCGCLPEKNCSVMSTGCPTDRGHVFIGIPVLGNSKIHLKFCIVAGMK